jgi:hypothetical protein
MSPTSFTWGARRHRRLPPRPASARRGPASDESDHRSTRARRAGPSLRSDRARAGITLARPRPPRARRSRGAWACARVGALDAAPRRSRTAPRVARAHSRPTRRRNSRAGAGSARNAALAARSSAATSRCEIAAPPALARPKRPAARGVTCAREWRGASRPRPGAGARRRRRSVRPEVEELVDHRVDHRVPGLELVPPEAQGREAQGLHLLEPALRLAVHRAAAHLRSGAVEAVAGAPREHRPARGGVFVCAQGPTAISRKPL